MIYRTDYLGTFEALAELDKFKFILIFLFEKPVRFVEQSQTIKITIIRKSRALPLCR